MRDLFRLALHFAAAVSAVLFVGTSVLWACTASVRYSFYAELPARKNGATVTRRGAALVSNSGRMCIEAGHRIYRDPNLVTQVPALADMRRFHFIAATVYEEEIPRPRLIDHALPFQAYHEWTGYALLPWSARGVVLPHAFVVAVTAALPLYSLRRLLNWRRSAVHAPSGRCHSCGYDLRATPDRCPECGSAPTVAK